MEFVPSKELSHVDGQSRLIPKFCVPHEDKVIAALQVENEVKKYPMQYHTDSTSNTGRYFYQGSKRKIKN